MPGKKEVQSNYIKKRGQAFGYAFSGLRQSLLREPHMQIHLSAALVVVAAGFFFKVSIWEWFALIFCIAVVIAAELFNTALEKICDMVQPAQDPTIKYVKDISSAAVLIICLASAIIGLWVFFPKIFERFSF